MFRCNELIDAHHGAAQPQNTVQAEVSAAKLWKGRHRMVVDLVSHGALDAFEAMLLTNTQSCRDS